MIEILKVFIIFTVILFFLNIFIEIIKCKRKGLTLGKVAEEPKKPSIYKRLFVLLPRQIVDDAYSRQDYEFMENGLHLFVGEQGSGKTISLVHFLMTMKSKYPKLAIRTNMSYKYEDKPIKSWRDLVFSNNGVYGQIDVIDEIQNWFNSLESKDFPPEMFSEITQQRKQKKCICGTSQVWQRVAKPIREQVKLVYKPFTIFGCLTIVRVYKPNVDDSGSIDNLKFRKIYFFVHNSEIRNAFDTYKKIQQMSLKGFKPTSEQYGFAHAHPSGLREETD